MAGRILLSIGDGPTTDHLNLTDGVAYTVRHVEYGENEITLDLYIYGSNRDESHARLSAVIEKLQQASVAALPNQPVEGVTLGIQTDTEEMVYFDVTGGDIEDFVWVPGRLDISCTVLVKTRPYARGAAYTETISTPLSQLTTHLIENVPGDVNALVRAIVDDVSTDGVINRLRLSRRSAKSIAAGDWVPAVNILAGSGSTTETDATAAGGSYTRSSVDNTWQTLGAVDPLERGPSNQGLFDVWARVRDNAVPLAAPSGLNVTVESPLDAPSVTLRQSTGGHFTGPQDDIGFNLGQATQDGNLLTIAAAVNKNETIGQLLSDTYVRNFTSGASPEVVTVDSVLDAPVAPGTAIVAIVKVTTGVILEVDTEMEFVTSISQNFENYGGGTEDYPLNVGVYIDTSGKGFSWGESPISITGRMTESGGQFSLLVDVVYAAVSGIDLENPVDWFVSGFWQANGEHTLEAPAGEVEAQQFILGCELFEPIVSTIGTSTGWTDLSDPSHDRGPMPTQYQIATETGQSISMTRFWANDDVHRALMVGFNPAYTEPYPAIIPPDGFLQAAEVESSDAGDAVKTALFYCPDAPPYPAGVSPELNVGMSPNGIIAAEFAEWTGAAVDDVLELVDTFSPNVSAAPFMRSSAPLAEPGGLLYGVIGPYRGGLLPDVDMWTNGFNQVGSGLGLGTAWRSATGIGPWSVSAALPLPLGTANILAAFRANPDTAVTGALRPGTYDIVLQAIDGTGRRSAVVTNASEVTERNSRLIVQWTAPAWDVAYYQLYWIGPSNNVYTVIIPGDRTFWFITEEAGAQVPLNQLPSIDTGEVTPLNWRLRVGSLGDTAVNLTTLPPQETSQTGEWVLAHLGTVQLAEGWDIEVQAMDPSGAGTNADIDCLMLVPVEDQSHAVVTYPGLNLSTQRRWEYIMDNHDRVRARLLDIATAEDAGRAHVAGQFTLAPDNNLIGVIAEVANGVSDVDSTEVAMTLEITPRYRFQRGGQT